MANKIKQMEDVPLIQVKNLKKSFPTKKSLFGRTLQEVKAVDDVSFDINRGETFGLVGESGSGKSTTGRSIIRLYDVSDGEILFDGHNLAHYNERHMKPFRRRMQAIFQDPYSSLNPALTVTELIGEPLAIHGVHSAKDRKEVIVDLLEKVGLKKEHADRYPYEFSGGQRQRISIARALSVKPEFVLCDEPISALDVSVQAQVVNMLEDIQTELGLTYLFIAHDLSMVRHISDRIGVMYLGSLAEIAESDELYEHPAHPYTQVLLSAIPVPDPRAAKRDRIVLTGDIPSSLAPPSGCKFRTHCPHAMTQCAEEAPRMKEISKGHWVACHLYDK